MAKILKIDFDNIIIGMDDHTTIQVPITDIPFDVQEMMTIDVYKHNDKYLFSTPTVVSQVGQSYMVNEKPIPGKRYVNKSPYVLWYFFLGGFGAHEFYSGNKKKAFAWILLTIFMYFIEGLPLWAKLSHYGLDAFANEYHYHRNLFYTGGAIIFPVIGWIYFFLIRILAVVSMCKQANENGRIPVSKWESK